ncbi:MAG TPA: carbon-nitrogen hydrolase family protein [Candidatus Limnocylindrales bacterium]|nr:carbon-nitrogen hydrolase family protein [Candidatus Limnocylindrales bacterium]
MRVAAIQLTSGADREANLERALEQVERAVTAGAELIVLPEYVDYLGPAERAWELAAPIPGPTVDAFAVVARQAGVWIVAGSVWERAPEIGRRCYNTSVLLDPAGAVAARYRKVHVFDVHLGEVDGHESEFVAAGDEVVVAPVDGLTMGLSVCYDLRFPEVYRAQALLGAQAFLVPSSFRLETGRDHWEVLIRARALENQCYLVAADQVGIDGRGIACYGRSMIADPWGTVLACAPDEIGFVMADIDPRRLGRLRAGFPALASRRDDVYGITLRERDGDRPLVPSEHRGGPRGQG